MQYDALHPNLWECANEDGSLVLKSCQSCKESLTVQLYHSECFASLVCDCALWLPGDCAAEYPSIPFNIAEQMIAERLIMMTGRAEVTKHRAQHTQPTFKNVWNTRNLELCHDGSIYAFSLPAKLSCNFQFPVIWWMSRNTLFSKFVENWKILGNLSWVPGLLTNCNKTTSPQQQFVTNMKIFGARF